MSTTSVALALELAIQLMSKAGEITKLINSVQSEGRTDLTPDEWNQVLNAYDAARVRLLDAIAAKKALEESIPL